MAASMSMVLEIVSRGPTYTVGRGSTPSTNSAVAGSRTRPWTTE